MHLSYNMILMNRLISSGGELRPRNSLEGSIFRAVGNYAATVCLEDGDETVFCQGGNGQMIDPPNPLFCNLKLAIASRASGLVAELYGDDDDDEAIVNQPAYLSGPLVSDDILFRRLHDRLPVT